MHVSDQDRVGHVSHTAAFTQLFGGLSVILFLLFVAVGLATGDKEVALMFGGLGGVFGFIALWLPVAGVAYRKVTNRA